jgi:hypothetical protein
VSAAYQTTLSLVFFSCTILTIPCHVVSLLSSLREMIVSALTDQIGCGAINCAVDGSYFLTLNTLMSGPRE